MQEKTWLKNFKATRAYLHHVVKDLSPSQLTDVPEGASNNILWNVGHVIVDGCDMIYRACGLASPLPENVASRSAVALVLCFYCFLASSCFARRLGSKIQATPAPAR